MIACDPVAMLRAACEEVGTQRAWAQANSVSAAYVNDVLLGRREPGESILSALGLRKVVTYLPTAALALGTEAEGRDRQDSVHEGPAPQGQRTSPSTLGRMPEPALPPEAQPAEGISEGEKSARAAALADARRREREGGR